MSTRALVTGATGHIGSNVVRALRAAGWTPIAFAREGADRRGLSGVEVEVRTGDLLDADSVRRAAEGVEVVFHVGAVHRNWAPDPADLERPAVEGTRNVLDAARAAGVRRVVYTSTGATVGFTNNVPLDESHFLEAPKAAYARGKVAAERLAREAAAGGSDVVILNPSGVFGPGDWRLTPATRAIVGMLQGDPAWLGVCVTDVRDVARAHVLAAEAGRSGERYLVTGECLAPEQVADLFEELGGKRPSSSAPPRWLLKLLGAATTFGARFTGKDTPFDPAALDDLDGGRLWYDSTRSRTELGVTYRPARDVLRDTFRWLLHVGALKPAVAERVRRRLGAAAAPDPDWS